MEASTDYTLVDRSRRTFIKSPKVGFVGSMMGLDSKLDSKLNWDSEVDCDVEFDTMRPLHKFMQRVFYM